MKTKYQNARIQVIDRELSKKDFVKTKDLVNIIKTELDITVSQRTVQKDIEQMQEDPPLGYAAPIGIDSKKKAYYYKEPFTIKAFGLKEEHINALLFYSKTLHQFQEYKIFNDIATAIEKVLDNFKIAPSLKKLVKSRVILQTEKAIPIRGHEHIPIITEALEENKKISFRYSPFGKNESNRIIAPCLLREDKHMWYVLGILEGNDSLKTFALDRIKSLSILDETFEPVPFDPDNYFKYSFGITVKSGEPKRVVLSFVPYQGNYLKALPIHETQKILTDNNKEFKISVNVKPSYEFFSKVLSYGPDVKVISPKPLVKELRDLTRSSYQNYI
jgi:predicted DNA-binding transcriptional regulator YafY